MLLGKKVGVVAAVALVAAGLSLARQATVGGADRDEGLERALARRGLVVDREGVLWLEVPPFSALRAGPVAVVVRARPAPDDPHDIFLASARLSPEGVLLEVGPTFNLTETSAVDEGRPVGGGSRFAFREELLLGGQEGAATVRLVDLAGPPAEARQGWSRLERMQAALTRLQDTGRLEGVARVSYHLEPAPRELAITLRDDRLRIDADDRSATIALDAPLEVPGWLGVETLPERQPGSLVTWSVDRVRAVVGDEAMQYVKAVFFSAQDAVLSQAEDLSGDTGADDIAADLGQAGLEPLTQAMPVNPDIGFPPPPLEPFVTPALPAEGVWNGKTDDPFIHSLPGLPPTFVTTFIRSDQRRKQTRVYIALWDPRLVELHMMAGTAEPKSATGATGPGLIPREPEVLGRVAAAMNAGFQALHGEYGMMGDGVVYLPPKPYAATVATTRDGSTVFGTWPVDPAIPGDMLSYRQNMTPLVIDGKYNPYGRTWWGGTPPDWEDKTHTTRTGMCLTREGFVGYFYGNDLSPNALAQAMIQARCAYGLALDMNAGHSGLEFYKVAPAADLGELGRPIDRSWERTGDVPGMEGWSFRAKRLISSMGLMHFPRYIKREGRDFFYLTLRHVLPGAPLAEASPWQVESLPQHGFPYALARTELTIEGKKSRVLAIDPRMVTATRERAVANAPVVAAIGALPPRDGDRVIWSTPDAFSIDETPPTSPAARVAAGPLLADQKALRAAIGVQDAAGMLLYVEVEGEVSGPALAAMLAAAGCSEAIALDAPLALALGGDTALGGSAVRLEGETTTLWRKESAAGRQIFPDTPVVPLDVWHPLQSRRIRYFKKTDT
jgi:hypothetical protein